MDIPQLPHAAGPAWARLGPGPGLAWARLGPGWGRLATLIDLPQASKKKSIFYLNIRGAQGPMGPMGPHSIHIRGAQGPMGPKGPKMFDIPFFETWILKVLDFSGLSELADRSVSSS